MSVATAAAHDDELPGWGDPQEFQFKDRDGVTREFTGWLLAEESTEVPHSRRWTVLEAYRTVGGSYVLRTLGCSVEYHRANSDCNTGERKKARDMEIDLEPCRRCKPRADYMNPALLDEEFNVEVEIPTIKVSTSPKDFIRSLHRGNEELSFVAFRLLRALREIDPDIRAEQSKPRHIS